MRKLVWFAVGFAAACALGAYLVSGWWLLLLGVFCLCAAIPIFFLKSKIAKITAIVLLGSTVSFLWFWAYDAIYLCHARQYDGMTVTAQVELTDYSYENDYGIGADGMIELDGKPFRIRIYVNESRSLKPGDTITGDIRLRLTTRDGAQEPTYHQGSGIFLLGYVQENASFKSCIEISVRYFAARLRARILDLIDRTFPEDTLGFARALLLGDSSKLTYAQDTAFQVSGIRHVIAVSGLHVSILFSVVCLVSGHRRYLTALIGIPVLFVFAALAGFTPSVVRACIMQGLVILALLLNREYDPPTALAAAVVLMLFASPMTITSVSFQLSAGCMVGIFLFSAKIQAYMLRGRLGKWAQGKSIRAKLIRWAVSGTSVTLSAMVTTTPLCAWHFGTVSLVGVLTNLLTLWVISFIFYGIMLSCAVGALWLPAGKLIAWIISWPIRYVLGVADLLSQFPLAAVYTCSIYIVVWLVLCYALLAVFLLGRKKHPVILTCCMVLSLGISMFASWLEPKLDDYRVTVFDVGQGECILFQCDGKYYLVDCGGENDTAVADQISQHLLSQGVSRLDGTIVTHYDRDHVGAMDNLLSRLGTKKLYLPDICDDSQLRQSLSDSFSNAVCWIGEDTVISETGFTVKLFAVSMDTGDNESCMCILFQTENCDILITGDRGISGEQELISHGPLPELELLVVGHHGSATSTGSELLLATRPKNAVISVGRDNYYNHPAQEVLKRLSRFDSRVWRTDLHGTILFRG